MIDGEKLEQELKQAAKDASMVPSIVIDGEALQFFARRPQMDASMVPSIVIDGEMSKSYQLGEVTIELQWCRRS